MKITRKSFMSVSIVQFGSFLLIVNGKRITESLDRQLESHTVVLNDQGLIDGAIGSEIDEEGGFPQQMNGENEGHAVSDIVVSSLATESTMKPTHTFKEVEQSLGCDSLTLPKKGKPDCGSDTNHSCWNKQVKAYLKIMAKKSACDQLKRPKQPCGQALEGKWRGSRWWGPFQAFGEIVWSDVSMSKTAIEHGKEWMDSQTKNEGWGSLLARSFGQLVNSSHLKHVGVVDEEIHEHAGDLAKDWGYNLAKGKVKEMTIASTLVGDDEELGEGGPATAPDLAEPICIVERHLHPSEKKSSEKVWGLVYKAGMLSGATAYESSKSKDLKNSGEVSVKVHKGTAGDVSFGKVLKIQWFVTKPEKGNEDLVTAEWTKVLEPLGVMPISEEGRRVRILKLIIGRFAGNIEIIRSGIKSKSKWLRWIRKWTAYCTITCMGRWVKVFYYSFKMKFESQKLMWLSQRQKGWGPSALGGPNFQEETLNALDTTTKRGLERVGTMLKRNLWNFMSFMIETTDHSFLLRTQFLFHHAIKQLVIGWILRILGIDDMSMSCKWKSILEIMEKTQNYKRHSPNFWILFTTWCPGWMEQLDPDRVTFKAFQWVSNNTASLTKRLSKSWFLQKTKNMIAGIIRKIHNAVTKGLGMVLNGIVMLLDDIALKRLTRLGVIDEEEKKMMQQNTAPPSYPSIRKGSTAQQALGCLAYFNTDWIQPKKKGILKRRVVPNKFKYSKSAYKGRMRVRNGVLTEGVVELRRHKECKKLSVGSNMKRLWHKLAGPDKEIRVLALDAVSEIIDIGNSTRLQGEKLKKGALRALEGCVGDSGPVSTNKNESETSVLESEVRISPNTKMCQYLASKWTHLPAQGIFREGYKYCVLLLSFTDRDAFQHVLCARTKDEIEGWKSSIEFHRFIYRGEDRTEENEFAAALEEEMDAASATVEEVMTRHNLQEKDAGADSEPVETSKTISGATNTLDAELENGIKMKQGNFATAVLEAFSVQEENHSSNQNQAEVQAALAASNAAVDAAVAKYRVGLGLVKNDATNIKDAIDIFQSVFLEAHSHVRFLHSHNAAVIQYHCKTAADNSRDYDPGDCVKSEDYKVSEHGAKWVSCRNEWDCDWKLEQNSYSWDCMKPFAECAKEVSDWGTGVINRDQYAQFEQGCFPSSALVEVRPPSSDSSILQQPILRPIAEVRVGDFVRTADGFERVFAVTQWHPEAERVNFVRLVVSMGDGELNAALELTHRHFLPVNGKLVRADAIRVDDQLSLADGNLGRVIAVHEVRSKGYHNVKTPSGLIAVRAPGSSQAVVASTAVDHGLPEWIQANVWLELPLQVVSYVLPSLLDAGGPFDTVSTYWEYLSRGSIMIPNAWKIF